MKIVNFDGKIAFGIRYYKGKAFVKLSQMEQVHKLGSHVDHMKFAKPDVILAFKSYNHITNVIKLLEITKRNFFGFEKLTSYNGFLTEA